MHTVRMTRRNRWRHALSAWRGTLTVKVLRDSDDHLIVIADSEAPEIFNAAFA